MIGKLTGKLIESSPPIVMIDINGVGYEVEIPLSVLGLLPLKGEVCSLYTHFVVREDAQLLYGFWARQDRELFRLLLKVNGVGPKLAMAILSHMTTQDLVRCVNDNDVVRLTKMPGVGKKTAERLLIEMRDRLKGWEQSPDSISVSNSIESTVNNDAAEIDDAKAAMQALGYKPAEAEKVVNSVYQPGMLRDDIIRLALKGMAK